MREETRPEGSSAVDSAQDSGCGRVACAKENHAWNWGMGDEGSRSERVSLPRVNWDAWPVGAGDSLCQWGCLCSGGWRDIRTDELGGVWRGVEGHVCSCEQAPGPQEAHPLGWTWKTVRWVA